MTMGYNYSEIVEYLLDWYECNARILPWRENKNPYYIWVSEIMLQQTRVEAVKGYFERFISELPTIKELAEVEEERLLKLWEGLGYYNRARNLQTAAVTIMEEYSGELPSVYEELLKLKGIGSYTAGAIASIAFGIPVPAVDGNVLRVGKRVAGSFDDISKAKVKKELEEDLKGIMPKDRAGDFNQALMELGAIVCLPGGIPLCSKCPLMHLCKGFKDNTFKQIPVKPEKKQRRIEERTVLILEYQDRIAIRKRAAKGLLAGLWEFPNMEGYIPRYEIEDMLGGKSSIEPLGEAKHLFSHIEWRMKGYRVKLEEYPENNSYIWATKGELEDKYSIPSAFQAYKSSVI